MTGEFIQFILGDLITIATIIGSGIMGVYALLSRLSNVVLAVQSIDKRIDTMEVELKKQTDILIELAQTKERLNSSDKRIDELSKRLDEVISRLAKG